MVFRTIGSLVFFLLCSIGWSQSSVLDSVIQLDQVVVKGKKLYEEEIGQQVIRLDKFDPLSNQHSVSDLIRQTGASFIKDYGPGRLSTISIQGGSASQAAFIWNGVPIQQAQLGQLDFALLPVQFFDNLILAKGGNSSRWGSGSVSGSILANQQLQLRTLQQLKVGAGIGSFGQQAYDLDAQITNEDWGHSTKLFYEQSANDYSYEDLNGEDTNLSNSRLEQFGFLEEVQFKLSSKQQLGVWAWYQQTHREIPPTLVQDRSVARQDDETLRLLMDWQYQGTHKYQVKVAWLQDQLFFTDSLTNTNSDNRFQTLFGEVSTHFTLFPKHDLSVGLVEQYTYGRSTNFDIEPSRNQLGFWLKYQVQELLPQWNLVAQSRLEYIDNDWAPATFRLGIERKLSGLLTLNAAISRTYRLPTFNDWYWEPGGNPKLEPELGFEQSLGIESNYAAQALRLNYQLEIFNRKVNNWVIWLPQGQFWTPQNVREVQSYGLNQFIEVNHQLNSKWEIGWGGAYQYTRSINLKTTSPNDRSLKKQLIYVPIHQGQISTSLSYSGWRLNHWWTYTGEVYTTADNSSELPDYILGNASLQKEMSWAGHQFLAALQIQNITNKNYQTVLNYPMPRSQWSIRLQWQLSKTKNIQNE